MPSLPLSDVRTALAAARAVADAAAVPGRDYTPGTAGVIPYLLVPEALIEGLRDALHLPVEEPLPDATDITCDQCGGVVDSDTKDCDRCEWIIHPKCWDDHLLMHL